MATTAAILSAVRTAVVRTVAKGSGAGTACVVRPPLDFDRFLIAMMNPLGGQVALRPDPDASLSKLIFDRAPRSHDLRLKTLITVVNLK